MLVELIQYEVRTVEIKLLLKCSMFGELLIAAGILILLTRKSLLREFYALGAFLVVVAFENAISIPTLFFRKELGIPMQLCYNVYFYSHWVCFFLEYSLLLLVVYSVFRKAMKPLDGLHQAGKIIFRWVGGVSLALSLCIAFVPHNVQSDYVATLTSQIQQGISVLALCLLLFVCFSTRYLGLTYRSYIFGVSLGLGVFATTSLVESAWYASSGAQTLYSPVYLFSAVSVCVALLTWGTYFAMPEPKRGMILLPTTSPYFLWNAISEALGDEPGFVAVAGFTPDMLAPAEMTALEASSKWSQELQARRELEEADEKDRAAREFEAFMTMQRTVEAREPVAMPR